MDSGPMLLSAMVLAAGAAALASWYVAGRQGRSARTWALWTLLLGGLPLLWLAIDGLFGLPKAAARARHECCAEQEWTAVADFGHAGGVDLDLGKCANCGAYLMAVCYGGWTTYNVISKDQAERFLALQGTPELKRALKAWVD